MDTVNITADAIRELAQKHPGAAEDLKALCPDAFKPQPIKFDEDARLSTYPRRSIPCLFIGNALAPSGLEYRCLIVDKDWRMETQEYGPHTILTFYRK